MLKLKLVLITICMVLAWGITVVVAIGSPTYKGKLCIFVSGLLINTLLGIYYSYLKQRPASFKAWLEL